MLPIFNTLRQLRVTAYPINHTTNLLVKRRFNPTLVSSRLSLLDSQDQQKPRIYHIEENSHLPPFQILGQASKSSRFSFMSFWKLGGVLLAGYTLINRKDFIEPVHAEEIESANINQETFEERPSHYTCAQFCCLSYKSECELRTKNVLPKGWEFLDVEDKANADGYFGVAFVNHQTKQVILSHQGTDTLFNDLQTDVIGVVGGAIKGQQQSAIRFTRSVLRKSQELGNYRLGIVGHSLGGWLAQLTAALCNAKGYEEVYAFSLDTPGAREMIKTYFEGEEMISMIPVDEEHLDFTNYLSFPNFFNTCNTQIGDTLHITPHITPLPFFSLARFCSYVFNRFVDSSFDSLSADYLKKTHSSEAQLTTFDPQSGMPHRPYYKVLRWPSLKAMGKNYPDFFTLMRKNIHSLPKLSDLPSKDRYFITYVSGYNVEEVQSNQINLCHFSMATIEWLRRIRDLDSNELEVIEASLNVPSGTLRNLLQFKVAGNILEVCTPDMSAWEFKNQVLKLLKNYPKLHSLAIDPRFQISEEVLNTLLNSPKTKLIETCEGIIPARLYLYDPAREEEINGDIQKQKDFQNQIEERDAIIETLSKSDSPAAQHWVRVAQNQREQLEIIEGILEILIFYKKRLFEEAKLKADDVLKLMENPMQAPRLKASIYALKAKIDRSIWQEERDLENSEKNYLKSLSPGEGLPKQASLWSNYGALLNNWAEWLYWEGRTDEALEKHRKALSCHRKAHELSLEGDWLFLGQGIEGVKRDYGRGLYLLAKAERETGKITEEIFQNKLNEALVFFPEEGTSEEKKAAPVTLLFKGIILQEMKKVPKALSCYESGLVKTEQKHVTLLRRKGEALLSLSKKEQDSKDKKKLLTDALKAAEASKEGFLNRKTHSPEDKYRLGLTEELIKNIQEEIKLMEAV